MPIDCGRSRRGFAGFTQPRCQAVSVMNFSMAPMVTVPWPDCSMTQLLSHSRSWGQMRPQISGQLLVADEAWYASRSEEHTSELKLLMSISSDVLCLKKR